MINVEIKGMEKALADIRGYSDDVAREVTQGINDTAEDVRGDAIRMAPVNKRSGGGLGARGGSLRRLIVAEPARNFEATVESRAKYSEFVEFGTGISGENPKGGHRSTPWIYFDEATQSFVWTRGNRPQPFLNPAAEMNRRKHSERMIKALKK